MSRPLKIAAGIAGVAVLLLLAAAALHRRDEGGKVQVSTHLLVAPGAGHARSTTAPAGGR
jgi:hypothetical protein